MAETWKTAVTSIAPNEIRVRGIRIDEMMGRISFGEADCHALDPLHVVGADHVLERSARHELRPREEIVLVI